MAIEYFYVATKSWPREGFTCHDRTFLCRDKVGQCKKNSYCDRVYLMSRQRIPEHGFPMSRHSALCHDGATPTIEPGVPRLGAHNKKMHARQSAGRTATCPRRTCNRGILSRQRNLCHDILLTIIISQQTCHNG